MTVKIFDDSELQEMPPDLDNFFDQLTFHVYHEEVFDAINESRTAQGSPTYNDPEEILADFRWKPFTAVVEYDRLMKDISGGGRTVDIRIRKLAWELRKIGVEIDDDLDGRMYTLSTIPIMDPLNMFYEAYIKRYRKYNIVTATWGLVVPAVINLALVSENNELCAVAKVVVSISGNRKKIYIEDVAWSDIRGYDSAWLTGIAAWFWAAHILHGIDTDAISNQGRRIIIPFHIKEQVEEQLR